MLKKIRKIVGEFEDIVNEDKENLSFKFLKVIYHDLSMSIEVKNLIIENIQINLHPDISFEEELILEKELKIIAKHFNKLYQECLTDGLDATPFIINEAKKINLIH